MHSSWVGIDAGMVWAWPEYWGSRSIVADAAGNKVAENAVGAEPGILADMADDGVHCTACRGVDPDLDIWASRAASRSSLLSRGSRQPWTSSQYEMHLRNSTCVASAAT